MRAAVSSIPSALNHTAHLLKLEVAGGPTDDDVVGVNLIRPRTVRNLDGQIVQQRLEHLAEGITGSKRRLQR